MSYELDQLVAKFRSSAGDLTTPYLWSDDEVYDYLAEAEDEFAALVECLKDSIPLSYAASDTEVPIPEYITRIRGGTTHSGARLRIFNDEDFGSIVLPVDWQTSTAAHATTLIVDAKENSGRLYPIPTGAGTITLRVYRRPTTSLEQRGALEITDPQYQRCILLKVLASAYSKHDSDTYSPELAREYETRFYGYCAQFSERVRRGRPKQSFSPITVELPEAKAKG
jgi:hypothetical protein